MNPGALLLVAAALGLSQPAAAADESGEIAVPVAYKKLPSGRYAVKVSGMLTTTCGRAIELELAQLPEIESAQVDFDAERLVFTIRLDQTLRVSALKRALHRAAVRVNLGTDYIAEKISYSP